MTTPNMKDALRFQYQNASVTVVALKMLDEFTIQDLTFGPVKKSGEFDVPRWVADVLVAANQVKLKAPTMSVPDLQKALWRETGEPVLQPLSANYYFQIRTSIQHLATQNQQNPNDVRLATQTKMEQLLRDLIANRLLKLMKLSLREERIHETKKKMTHEERWLFDRLINLLRQWQTQVMEIEIGD